MNVIQAAVQAILPSKRKVTTGGWVSFNAPCCQHRGERADKRLRGGVMFSPEGFTYHCFNCGFKAGWQPGKLLSSNTKSLFHWLGMPSNEINKLILETLREKDKPGQQKGFTFTFDLHDVALPDDSKSIIQWATDGDYTQEITACIEYVLSRGLTLEDYNWHWSAANGYRDRILIPFYYKGKVVGYTGRKLGPGKPKYLTSSQSGYLFNEDAQTYDRQYVIVVEGQFDAIAIGGVAIMTNDPNEIQCARINALGKEVIVVPDKDAPGASMLAAALKNGWSMSLPPWSEEIKDVADAVKKYGKVYTLATILHYKISNKIKIELQKKKLEKLKHEE